MSRQKCFSSFRFYINCGVMFPDSDIKKKKNNIHVHKQLLFWSVRQRISDRLALRMKHEPFSIAADGSNDGEERIKFIPS